MGLFSLYLQHAGKWADWVVERIKHKLATAMMVRTRDNTMLLATELANRDFLQRVQKYVQSRRLCDPLGAAKWLKIRPFSPRWC